MARKANTNTTNTTRTRAPMVRTRPPRNWRAVFLRELAIDGNRRRAAEAAQVDHTTVYTHRNSDPEFRAQWDAAIDQAAEYLEEEATRRATEGVLEPLTCSKGLVYDTDGNVVMVRKYSDSLMQLLLKGARPQKYRDNVSVTAPATLGVSIVLEQMRNDRTVAAAANDFLGLITSVGEAR